MGLMVTEDSNADMGSATYHQWLVLCFLESHRSQSEGREMTGRGNMTDQPFDSNIAWTWHIARREEETAYLAYSGFAE